MNILLFSYRKIKEKYRLDARNCFIGYSSLVSRCHDKFVLAQGLIMTAADEGSAGL